VPGRDLLGSDPSRECCHVHAVPSGDFFGASRSLELFNMHRVCIRDDLSGRQPRMPGVQHGFLRGRGISGGVRRCDGRAVLAVLCAAGARGAHWGWSAVRRGRLCVGVRERLLQDEFDLRGVPLENELSGG